MHGLRRTNKDKRKAGLRLDLKEGPFQKLESGAFALVPGKPAQSKLLQLVTLPLNDDDHMPPKKTGTLVLKKAGAIEYYCRYHPNMKATLTVSP